MRFWQFILAVSLIGGAAACGDEADTSDSALLQKRWGELSDSEIARACALVAVAPVGEYVCEDTNAEAFEDSYPVASVAECERDAKLFPPECPVTVQQALACQETIDDDTCAALASGGACDLFPSAVESLCN